MKWRIIFLILIVGIFYSALVYNLYQIQIVKGKIYERLAQAQVAAGGKLEAPRGNIYFTDKNNTKVAAVLNKDYPIIFAVPTEIQKNFKPEFISEIAGRFSGILAREKEEIEKQLNKKNDQYELLITKASEEQLRQIQDLNIKGIYVKSKILRFYPFEKLGAHILGFVSSANDKESAKYGNIDLGRYGIELYFNEKLTGKSGEVKGDIMIDPEKGDDVYLTIDRDIQVQAEEILKKLIDEYKGEAGSVIVQEPKTGKILAMANIPDFDPNNYSEFGIEKFLNPAVESLYEPGSVFKLITMAAGLDSGKLTPSTTYFDTGSFTANSKTISNWDFKTHGAYGKITMTDVIENSVNTGAVFAQRRTGPDIFYNYLNKFGFSEITGIDLPGEVKGNLKNLKKGKDIDFATASYGQGVSVTPIELINSVSAIANGGLLMRPYITADSKPQTKRRVISEKTAKQIKNMMVSAVDKNKVATIPDYAVAGKTGTAFIPNFVKRGYTDQVVNTYVGFAPASDPKFVILIKLEKPEGSPLAGQTVVPAFRELARFILNYLNIPPDNLNNKSRNISVTSE